MELKKTVHLTYKGLKRILDAQDDEDSIDIGGYDLPSDALQSALEAEVNLTAHANEAVLGIDVYRYSQLKPLKQSLIPFALRLIYSTARHLCQDDSPYLFQKCTDRDFNNHYIDTGDGGFQLFDTPIHALVFAINFELVLRVFNSFRFYPRLRSALGADISLRYAISYGGVFSFEKNLYGPSIITNARMLSKDHLNRFLIDQNTFDWFTKYTRGIENISRVGMKDLQNLPDFAQYDLSLAKEDKQLFFLLDGRQGNEQHWKDVDVLKLGDVSAKTETVCIYGVHIHYLATLTNSDDNKRSAAFTITLGNLNTSGID